MKAISLLRRLSWMPLAALAFHVQLATAASDPGVLTVGTRIPSSCVGGVLPLIQSGFIAGSLGSYSPASLTGGKTLLQLYDYEVCANATVMQVSGFSSNPGSTWLSSVSCGGGALTGSGAASFGFAGGVASWTWATALGFANQTTLNCTILHN